MYVKGSGKLFTHEEFSDKVFILSLKAEIKEIDLWNHELASMDASTRIEWAVEKFGNGVVASTSFGLQSAVMIHLLKQASSEIPIIFVDTGYLFPATYEYAGNLQEHLTFQVKTYSFKYK